MFWDRIAGIYNLFEKVYNCKVYHRLGEIVAAELSSSDVVLECACGTGNISKYMAPVCKRFTATDFSVGMCSQAKKALGPFDNAVVECADMNALTYADDSFDVVVAGNVIHLLDDPACALQELSRVCKANGKLILPTFINDATARGKRTAATFSMVGVAFKRQFSLESYRAFLTDIGYCNAEYKVIDGRLPCAVAIVKNKD